MSRSLLNAVLLLLFVGVVLLNLGLRPQPAVPNVEILPEMVRTPRYNAFSAHPDLPQGMTLQPPAAATIPRGLLPLYFREGTAEAVRAGNELTSPLVMTVRKVIERGQFVYQNFCLPCHGTTGSGNGPVALRGFPAPPSLLAEKALAMRDGQMFHILTYGQNNMASYAAQLSREDRWKVIAYVRTLQKAALQAPPRSAPAKVTAGGQP